MGTGEVTRYIGKYGTKRVRKAVLIGTLGPVSRKDGRQPGRRGQECLRGHQERPSGRTGRPSLMDFLHNFYNYDVTAGKLVSERVLEDELERGRRRVAIGTLTCVDSWIEDFRQDIARNTVPTLILHGDADRILPADATSRRQAKLIKKRQIRRAQGRSRMACFGPMLSRSILNSSNFWRNSTVGTCSASAALAATDTAHPFAGIRGRI